MSKQLIVIGGGVVGLAIAFELQRRGHRVTILEKNECGGQASGAAAGMLAPFSEIAEDPDDFFELCLESLHQYKQWITDVKEISGQEFEYTECGSYYIYFHEADELALEQRAEWQNKYGAKAKFVSKEEFETIEPNLSKEILGALHYPTEAHVYAPDYVKALEKACRDLGVHIIENCGVLSFEELENKVIVTNGNERFLGEEVIIATGAWAKEWEEQFNIRIPVFPIRGQICAYDFSKGHEVNHLIFSSQSYLTPKGNGTLVCGASEDVAGFSTEITDKGIGRLIRWSEKMFPTLKMKEPFHRWAGLRPATQDGFPLLGRLTNFPKVHLAVGHYRNGILLSPITALMIADEIEGKEPLVPFTYFNPERFS